MFLYHGTERRIIIKQNILHVLPVFVFQRNYATCFYMINKAKDKATLAHLKMINQRSNGHEKVKVQF